MSLATTNNNNNSINQIALIILLLVQQSSSWKVLDGIDQRDYSHLKSYKNFTQNTNRQNQQVRHELWPDSPRSFSASNSIQTSIKPFQDLAKFGSATNHNAEFDADVFSLASRGSDHETRSKSDAPPPVEWDDEGYERGDEEENVVIDKSNSYPTIASQKYSNTVGQQLNHPIRFELKNLALNSIDQNIAPYQFRPISKPSVKYLVGRPIATNKLIYHGRLIAANKNKTQTRFEDGVEMNINIHEPVVISRRLFSTIATNSSQPKSLSKSNADRFAFKNINSDRETDAYSTEVTVKPNPSTTSTVSTISTGYALRDSSTANSQEIGSSSDWQPIVMLARTRRSGKTSNLSRQDLSSKLGSAKFNVRNTTELTRNEAPNSNVSKISQAHDNKWKPIIGTESATKLGMLLKFKKSPSWAMKIEQPFDREDEYDVDETRAGGARDVSSDNFKLNQDKWRPLETSSSDLQISSSSTTISSIVDALPMTTTQQPPSSPRYNSGIANSSASNEAAQRSASDLNYIYSSQPGYGNTIQQQVQQQPTSSSNYYGNYQVPAQQVDLPPQITPTIIDTTSGQTPEMVPERTPIESGPIQAQYDYSSSLQQVSFPPPQAPPSRQPSNYGYGYASNNFDQPARTQTQTQQQPVRQSQPTQIRQEHHYHYYNQPTPPSAGSFADRQQSFGSGPPTPSPAPAQQTVIRELQPIMITQPFIQQSSTTPAPIAEPQIIREIIREVPVQSVQIQPIQVPTRFIMQQQAPVPPPVIPPIPGLIRDGGFYAAPAKRLMRQITESIPQVAIRMPSTPQFRIQVPQLGNALRTTGVTRQTGSFVVPPMPKKTTTLMTETQDIPTHTTIIHSTQYTPATRTTVYQTDHQTPPVRAMSSSYKK